MAENYNICDFRDNIDRIYDDCKNKDFDGTIKDTLNNLFVVEDASDTEKTQKFLTWTKQHKKLQVVSAVIPYGILPAGFSGTLHDVKVFSRHGPDDPIYDADEKIRQQVARGNCVLELDNNGGTSSLSMITYALKKFTGGLGDDDDKDRGDNHTWKRYFTKPLSEAVKVVCTDKANGEAAHLSATKISGQIYICGGSKNVHMLFRNKEDIEKYTESRYRIASKVCETILNLLESMDDKKRTRLLEFLCFTKLTGVFEILCPDHQHVEDLSYLKRSELRFIAWTSTELEPPEQQQLCHMAPDIAIEISRALGLPTVNYTVIPADQVEERMKEIRRGYNYEGQVLYFMDDQHTVIGLLKKKTIWYIVCRAIREKVRGACAAHHKNENTFSIDKSKRKIAHRLKEIQTWLGLDDDSLAAWTDLGGDFLTWCIYNIEKNDSLCLHDVGDMFPVTWKKFLQDTGKSDQLEVKWEEPQGSDD